MPSVAPGLCASPCLSLPRSALLSAPTTTLARETTFDKNASVCAHSVFLSHMARRDAAPVLCLPAPLAVHHSRPLTSSPPAPWVRTPAPALLLDVTFLASPFCHVAGAPVDPRPICGKCKGEGILAEPSIELGRTKWGDLQNIQAQTSVPNSNSFSPRTTPMLSTPFSDETSLTTISLSSSPRSRQNLVPSPPFLGHLLQPGMRWWCCAWPGLGGIPLQSSR